MAAIALLMAWRMSSSEIPCLRALGRISTTTTLVVASTSGNLRANRAVVPDNTTRIPSCRDERPLRFYPSAARGICRSTLGPTELFIELPEEAVGDTDDAA
jgi:hypothetical protein